MQIAERLRPITTDTPSGEDWMAVARRVLAGAQESAGSPGGR